MDKSPADSGSDLDSICEDSSLEDSNEESGESLLDILIGASGWDCERLMRCSRWRRNKSGSCESGALC